MYLLRLDGTMEIPRKTKPLKCISRKALKTLFFPDEKEASFLSLFTILPCAPGSITPIEHSAGFPCPATLSRSLCPYLPSPCSFVIDFFVFYRQHSPRLLSCKSAASSDLLLAYYSLSLPTSSFYTEQLDFRDKGGSIAPYVFVLAEKLLSLYKNERMSFTSLPLAILKLVLFFPWSKNGPP